MCRSCCIDFGQANLSEAEIRDKSVLEVGSLDVNGSLRPIVKALHPRSYVGVDIQKGSGVDELCRAECLVKRFGRDIFDLVIATEMLEHARDWRAVISNLKRVLRPDGVLLITTVSRNYPYHGFPFDFWRYELSDIRTILSDLTIEVLEEDEQALGVFVKARKPRDFGENNLVDQQLYSIIRKRHMDRITGFDMLRVRCRIRLHIRPLLGRILPGPMKRAIKWMIGESRRPR